MDKNKTCTKIQSAIDKLSSINFDLYAGYNEETIKSFKNTINRLELLLEEYINDRSK